MEPQNDKKVLIAVGFWASYLEKDLPDINGFIDKSISLSERLMLSTYLKKQFEYEVWRGWSYCRFNCGIPEEQMGHSDYTDGKYVWPEGLSHYIEKHDLWLPSEFVDHVANNFDVKPDVRREEFSYRYDFSWWKSLKK